ncbi:C4BPA protein, partial [Daphoenositta chrysoptera]|nr:C4BPA protein [Daphoenositta chrysoptera]
ALRWLCALLLALPGAAGVCSQPPRFAFAEPVSAALQSYAPGAVVSYRCLPGYAKKAGESPDVTCLADSTWSRKSAFCTKKPCGPPSIENGDFHTQTDLLFGATVTFTCQVGYRLVGPPSAQCVVRNGEVSWDAVPTCEIVLCPPPPSIENGQLLDRNEKFTFGMAASYSCNKGLSLVGEATIFCSIGRGFQGVWSSPAPECKEVKCKDPQVKNGKKLSGFGTEHTYGNQVSFECNPGYSMKGSSVVTCDANSAWTPPLPTCDQMLCGRPPELPFGTPTTAVGDSSPLGTRVMYRCIPGYEGAPGRSSVITCQSDATWSAPDPHFCVPAQCPSPRVQYGRVSPGRYFYRTWDTVTFSCNPGYALQGPRSSTCGADSRWSPPLPQCKKVRPCPMPPQVANGNHNGQGQAGFTMGMSVRYTCNPGFYLVGNPTVSCRASGTWSQPRPRCEG